MYITTFMATWLYNYYNYIIIYIYIIHNILCPHLSCKYNINNNTYNNDVITSSEEYYFSNRLNKKKKQKIWIIIIIVIKLCISHRRRRRRQPGLTQRWWWRRLKTSWPKCISLYNIFNGWVPNSKKWWFPFGVPTYCTLWGECKFTINQTSPGRY